MKLFYHINSDMHHLYWTTSKGGGYNTPHLI